MSAPDVPFGGGDPAGDSEERENYAGEQFEARAVGMREEIGRLRALAGELADEVVDAALHRCEGGEGFLESGVSVVDESARRVVGVVGRDGLVEHGVTVVNDGGPVAAHSLQLAAGQAAGGCVRAHRAPRLAVAGGVR